jgi:hypothetical protein
MTHNCNTAEGCQPLETNPSTGLPMVEHTGVDVGGNPYGVDMNQSAWVPDVPNHNAWEPSWDGL